MATGAETAHGPRIAFVSTRGGAPDPGLAAARTLARMCQASLVVLESAGELQRLAGPSPILVLKERERSVGGRLGHLKGDEALCATLPCPLLLYSGDPAAPNTVLAAVALRAVAPSDIDRSVVLWGKTLADWRGAPLHVVHAWSPVGDTIVTCPTRGLGARRSARRLVRSRRDRTERLDALLASCGLTEGVSATLGRGLPSKVLAVVAARTRADLLVVGHRARSWLGRLPRQPVDSAWSRPCMSLLAIDAEGARLDMIPSNRNVCS